MDFKSEISRVLLYDSSPSVYFEALRRKDDFSLNFPELYTLIGLRQNPKYHAEGDVWNHTMLVLDAAVKFRNKVENPLSFMLSALCHDFGKAVCTEEINGIIHSYGHESKGLSIIEEFLFRLEFNKETVDEVLNLTLLHMKPNTIAANNSSVKASNKMFSQAFDPVDLIYLAAADSMGQLPNPDTERNLQFLFQRLDIFTDIMSSDFFTEDDLIKSGVPEGEILKESYEYSKKLRLSCVKKEDNFKQTLSYSRKLQKKLINNPKIT